MHNLIANAISEDNADKNESSMDSDQASENRNARLKIIHLERMLPIVDFIIDTESDDIGIPVEDLIEPPPPKNNKRKCNKFMSKSVVSIKGSEPLAEALAVAKAACIAASTPVET